ncbi:hypothetical protein GW846_02785 [Candidatus Gracilibacteria bacterium]|nr:hypothetical protein [Candidatus Gracilibacteria bacterium]
MAQFYDTMLAQYIKNPGQRGLGLDSIAEREFEYKMISFDQITAKKTLNFEEVDLPQAAIYSGEDVYMTHKLYQNQKQNPYITQELKTDGILKSIEFPLMKVLSKMEMTGIKIERDILKGLGMQLESAIKELEIEIFSLAGENFNINSPKQVGEILFVKLGYPTAKKTKTGFSVNAEVLEQLAKDYPIASKIVEYRHYSKLKSTYVEGLLSVATQDDRIHTSYNQTIASTGRLSSTNPNLQNIPTGDGIAGKIRKAFIVDSAGDLLVAFDYSQVEVRLLAIMSGDENLLKAFKEGRDIHQVTAEFIFKTTEITSTQRKFAKAVNFGVIYGISPFGLTKMIDISQKEAREYIDAFYENYPKVREFYDATIASCKKNSYVETLFGRRRYIPSINDKNKMLASSAEREAINMPIQGSSADIIKIAMIRIDNFLEKGNFKSTMLLQVHDELVFNIVVNEYSQLVVEIPKIMESILKDAPIELKVDSGEGKNWKECK